MTEQIKDAPAVPLQDLRDWFAGQALAGMGMWTPAYKTDGSSYSGIASSACSPDGLAARAEWAYAQADALLKERAR